MRVMLLKDVYNLGRAGDIKRVADGYGRNFLIPQGLATLATVGAMKQSTHIREIAAEQREVLNQELGSVAEKLEGLELVFPVKSGQTGRLYGSVTTGMIVESIHEKTGMDIERRQIDSQPIKLIGVHKANVRLTIDLIPELTIVVHPEGESPESVKSEETLAEEEPTEAFAELQEELYSLEEQAAREAADAKAEEEAQELLTRSADAKAEEVEASIEESEETTPAEENILEEQLQEGDGEMESLLAEPTDLTEEQEILADSAESNKEESGPDGLEETAHFEDNMLEEQLQEEGEEMESLPEEPAAEE